MKTHDLARILTQLARWLRKSPNIEMEQLQISALVPSEQPQADALALSSLVAFSRFSKPEWVELIQQLRIPVEVRPSYSARDVMGKLMNYFADHPEARQALMDEVERQPRKASPELMKALSSLLKG